MCVPWAETIANIHYFLHSVTDPRYNIAEDVEYNTIDIVSILLLCPVWLQYTPSTLLLAIFKFCF